MRSAASSPDFINVMSYRKTIENCLATARLLSFVQLDEQSGPKQSWTMNVVDQEAFSPRLHNPL